MKPDYIEPVKVVETCGNYSLVETLEGEPRLIYGGPQRGEHHRTTRYRLRNDSTNKWLAKSYILPGLFATEKLQQLARKHPIREPR